MHSTASVFEHIARGKYEPDSEEDEEEMEPKPTLEERWAAVQEHAAYYWLRVRYAQNKCKKREMSRRKSWA